MKNILKVNKCLISVSDKTQIVNFAENLNRENVKIISTGNTFNKLLEKGIKVKKVESVTKFPEILQGRVKTLHPKIFGGILGDPNKSSHKKDMNQHNLSKFELVVVNLYPFESTIEQTKNINTCIENIDIGGPSLIRAAAKNFLSTAIVVDVNDYNKILNEIKKYGGISLPLSKILAVKAFKTTMKYDSIITNWMQDNFDSTESEDLTLLGKKISTLRYGENPHQRASIYGLTKNNDLFYEKLNGKELSYNNLNDLKLGIKLSAEFIDPSCVIIKHAIPSSVAEAGDIFSAWKKAFNADSLSAFGGVVIFNKTVDEKLAKTLINVFLELIVAPNFTKKALNIFSKKKNLRIIKIRNIKKIIKNYKQEFSLLPNCMLVQDVDNQKVTAKNLKIVSKRKPSKREVEDLIFAFRVVKYVRSNAIVIAKNKTTIGIGSGNTSRVDSVQFAIIKARRAFKGNKKNLSGSVLASDAFFPFSDSIKLASSANISSIIQPGGSINDRKVIESTNKEKISMVFTGKRCFSH